MAHLPKLTIAVDGYSSCGKSTFAKAIAGELSYIYIDSGAMYRAATLFALEKGFIQEGSLNNKLLILAFQDININFTINPDNGNSEISLNGKMVEENIRTLKVSRNVSIVSQVPEVREKMVNIQRQLGEQKGIVMDGRDIGTVVFPQADIKIFMTADPHVRALRRYHEMISKSMNANLDEIEKNINERDHLDTTREDSPLKMAADAILLDNTHMTPEEQMKWFKNKVLSKFS